MCDKRFWHMISNHMQTQKIFVIVCLRWNTNERGVENLVRRHYEAGGWQGEQQRRCLQGVCQMSSGQPPGQAGWWGGAAPRWTPGASHYLYSEWYRHVNTHEATITENLTEKSELNCKISYDESYSTTHSKWVLRFTKIQSQTLP